MNEMSKYTFAQLLSIFYRLHQDYVDTKTQDQFAKELNVPLRTLNNWFTGRYTPREPKVIERIAEVLSLTAFQTDLMFFSVILPG